MHSHLYAQTGHFVTPTEVAVVVLILLLLIVGGMGRKVLG
jgi:hypothetical protein